MVEFRIRKNVSLVLFIGLLTVSALFWTMGGTDAGGLKDGQYAGSAKGFNGDVSVAVTVSGGAISAIDVVSHSETPGISDPAFDGVVPAIVQSQSTAVDTISGATYTSKAIMEAVESAISKAKGLADGAHTGVGQGFGGEIQVEVTVEGGKVSAVNVLSHSETPGISDPAFKQVPQSIIDAQSAEVDTVSNATATSKGIIEAVKNAVGW